MLKLYSVNEIKEQLSSDDKQFFIDQMKTLNPYLYGTVCGWAGVKPESNELVDGNICDESSTVIEEEGIDSEYKNINFETNTIYIDKVFFNLVTKWTCPVHETKLGIKPFRIQHKAGIYGSDFRCCCECKKIYIKKKDALEYKDFFENKGIEVHIV